MRLGVKNIEKPCAGKPQARFDEEGQAQACSLLYSMARCYKPSKSLEEILEIFQLEKGRHFDPDMITLFFDHLDEFIAIRNKYATLE